VNWTSVFASVAAAATLLLIVAGGLVTSHEAGLAVVDWPNSYGYNMFLYPLSRMTGGIYYEHTHRLAGALVGLTTLALALHLQRSDSRRWVRHLGWAALVIVAVQGLLGGLRVTGRLTLSASPAETTPNIALAVMHGVVAQLFFALMVAIAVFTSTAWSRNARPTSRRVAGTDRALAFAAVSVVVLQLVFGAMLRHVSWGVHLHAVFAGVVALVVFAAAIRAWGLNVDQPILLRAGRLLMILIVLQLVLGIAALIARSLAGTTQPRPLGDVLFTTAHQVTGAVLLATTVALMLWTRRLLAASGAGRPGPGDPGGYAASKSGQTADGPSAARKR
jgi:cytochrome c oxidase assembly protein subunit 15